MKSSIAQENTNAANTLKSSIAQENTNAANMVAEPLVGGSTLEVIKENAENYFSQYVDHTMAEIFDMASKDGDTKAMTMQDVMAKLNSMTELLKHLVSAAMLSCMRSAIDADTTERRLGQIFRAETETVTESTVHAGCLGDAVKTKSFVRAKFERGFVDKGYGFVRVGENVVFVHTNAVRKQPSLKIGSWAFVKDMRDHSRTGEHYRGGSRGSATVSRPSASCS